MNRSDLRRASPRGFSLIEVMVATAVFGIAITGVVAMISTSQFSNAAAQREVQASSVMNDLLAQVSLWSYADARLANTTSGVCNSDPADVARAFESNYAQAVTDYRACAVTETTLATGVWNGIAATGTPPRARLTSGTSGVAEYERFLIVREEDRAGGLAGAANSGARKRIWGIVAFKTSLSSGRAGHRIVSMATKANPAVSR